MPATSRTRYPPTEKMYSVDVRDGAWDFAAATTADVAGEILLIAGEDNHNQRRRHRPLARPHPRPQGGYRRSGG
jgi:hypothetical protein